MTQRTLFLIKPDAQASADVVLTALGTRLAGNGHSVLVTFREVRSLTEGQVRTLYASSLNSFPQEYREAMIRFMAGGPCTVMILTGEDAVARVRAACGPTDPREAPEGTLRYRFGDKSDGAPVFRNAVHASDSTDAARREAFALLPEEWAYLFD